MATIAAILGDIWKNRIESLDAKHKDQQKALKDLNIRIGKTADRIIETDSSAAIQAFETKLEKSEAEKALIQENLATKPTKQLDFDKSFRTAMTFLLNPWNLWASPHPDYRKTVLKLVFAAPCHTVEIRVFEPQEPPAH